MDLVKTHVQDHLLAVVEMAVLEDLENPGEIHVQVHVLINVWKTVIIPV